MSKRSPMWVLLAGALVAAPAVQAGLYKWVDEDGTVVYSDKPPPGGEAQELKTYSSGVSAEEAEQNLESLRDKADAQSDDREIKEEVAKDLADREATIKKNCEIARKNKSLLETPARVTLKDEDGNDYFLGEEERQEKLRDAAAQVERYCT